MTEKPRYHPPDMETLIALAAAAGATFFAVDLWRDYSRKPRPHVAAYGAGITMFAIATWALFIGLAIGWTGAVYRTFFLFGAILNIPVLAIGSMFLVVGRRSGHALTIAIGAGHFVPDQCVSLWRKNRSIVWGNALILLGIAAAAWRGTGLALGDGGGFAFSLLLAVSLIWAGYKIASGKRNSRPRQSEEADGQHSVDQLESDRP